MSDDRMDDDELTAMRKRCGELFRAMMQTTEGQAYQAASDELHKAYEEPPGPDPDMMPRGELEAALLEIMRDPPASMLMTAGEVAALLYNPGITEYRDPTQFQIARTAQILRDMAKRGFICEIVPQEESYFIDKKFVTPRETAAGYEYVTVMVNAGQDYIDINNAIATLSQLYPGVPPGEALEKWCAERVLPEELDRMKKTAAALAKRDERAASLQDPKERAAELRARFAPKSGKE